MAIKLMTLAFETPYKPSPKVYLLALCDNANDQGTCFPSIATLSKKCSMGKTNITYLAKAYESIDLINRTQRKRDNGSDASTLYMINISKLVAVALSKDVERKKYLQEFEIAYKKAKEPKKGVHSVNTTKNKQKTQKVNTPVHSSEHLEPSINHQEISKDISSSKERESFNDFKKRIINFYTGLPLVYGPADYLSETLIVISKFGYLHNTTSNNDLNRDDAIAVWRWLYVNQEKILPIKEVHTA